MFFLGAVVSAGAAKLITSKDIQNGTIQLVDISKKARTSLKGASGAKGANGTPGAAGISGPAIIAGTLSANNGWTSPGGGGNYGSESSAQIPVPADSSYTAKSLIATVAAAPGAGKSLTVTLRVNGADTVLSCTIADSATSCTPPAGTTAVIPGGSKIAFHSVVGGGATTPTVAYAYRAEF